MTDRVLLGHHAGFGNYGLYVSRPGKDVSSTDPEDFIYSMGDELIETVISGRLTTYSRTSSTTFVQPVITHNLGFVPIFKVQSNNPRLYPVHGEATDTTVKIWIWVDGVIVPFNAFGSSLPFQQGIYVDYFIMKTKLF